MSAITVSHPWLEYDLGQDMQVLSWALNRPGLVSARKILWREVRNADLPADLDVESWLKAQLEARQATDAITFLTSRDLSFVQQSRVTIGETEAHAVATVGLSNAERVGHRVDRSNHDWGTINIALRLNRRLSKAAMLELMSVVVQARTTAVLEVDLQLPDGPATGTGTDCVAVAALPGVTSYAGLHTDIGEAAGRAVYTTVLNGAREWMLKTRRVSNKTT